MLAALIARLQLREKREVSIESSKWQNLYSYIHTFIFVIRA